MSAEEIKAECEFNYEEIRLAKERLAHLREICTHENTFQGNYSWRIGVTQPAIICSDCNKIINIITND